jgi:hypothetical protein
MVVSDFIKVLRLGYQLQLWIGVCYSLFVTPCVLPFFFIKKQSWLIIRCCKCLIGDDLSASYLSDQSWQKNTPHPTALV